MERKIFPLKLAFKEGTHCKAAHVGYLHSNSGEGCPCPLFWPYVLTFRMLTFRVLTFTMCKCLRASISKVCLSELIYNVCRAFCC